jgi:hypothetical protein
MISGGEDRTAAMRLFFRLLALAPLLAIVVALLIAIVAVR